MKTTRTVVCKLAPTPEQAADIDAALKAFAAACDFAAEAARRIGSTNKVKVQQAAYAEIRRRFGLSANLAIRAIARACAALKVPAKMHSTFAPTSIDYDARIFAFQEGNRTFGLTLLSGRVKIAAALGDYQERLLKGREPTAAQLVRRRDGRYFLHVQLVDEAPEPIATQGTIGVDMGVKDLATTDDGETFCGDGVERVRASISGSARPARNEAPSRPGGGSARAGPRNRTSGGMPTTRSASGWWTRPKAPGRPSGSRISEASMAGQPLARPTAAVSRVGRSTNSAPSSPTRRHSPVSR